MRILELFGVVTKREFNNEIKDIKDKISNCNKQIESFSKSYAYSWLENKSVKDLKELKKKLKFMVKNEKPEISSDYVSWESWDSLIYKNGTELRKTTKGYNKYSYSGNSIEYGNIPSSLAKDMFELSVKLYFGDDE